jgi:hypothetical protein
MNGQNEENLKELFERLISTEEAESGIEDFVKAERILQQYPAPEPDEELITAIKSDIVEAIRHRREHSFRRLAYRMAPVAAVLMILAAVSVRLFEKDGGGPAIITYASIIPASVWDSENIAADDADLAVLTAEIDELEGEVLTLELGENGGNGRSAVTELEMELVEINSDFWEG